ncbi:MAG: type II toxin-antitoxin system prevent-host-death family antitoxin [Myxococcota bacterium]
MTTVSFTEFRQHASGLLSEVEKGETVVILRHGKPIAELVPIQASSDGTPSWKRPALRLEVTGAQLSGLIVEEREGA